MYNYEEVEKIADLFLKEYNDSLNSDERLILDRWKAANPDQAQRMAYLISNDQLPLALKRMENAEQQISKKLIDAGVPIDQGWKQSFENLIRHEMPATGPESGDIPPTYSASGRRIHFLKKPWFRYAAAILLIVGSYLWFARPDTKPELSSSSSRLPVEDIAPGAEKALLTLADGSTIALDDAADGELAEQNGIRVIKKENGQLEYEIIGKAANPDLPASYNTMRTPRGGQYQLKLPDGSKVWLNAESSITYPVSFSGKERKVSVSGETYFEVTRDKGRPFYVEVGDARIEVLGTNFNINAYMDEPSMKTTLLEGSIKVTQGTASRMLSPGQQASVKEEIIVQKNVDIQQVMAWKNGLFQFENADLHTLMRQIGRWYDVEIVFEEQVVSQPDFVGGMQRNLNLSQVLRGLSSMGLKLKLEGRKLIVVHSNK